jgi:hypothetical protein
MSATVHPFPGTGQISLAAELEALNRRLAQLAGCADPEPLTDDNAPTWAIDRLVHRFGLSPGEKSAILFAAASELCADTAALVARIGNGPPTFGLAMRVCEGLEWTSLRPDAALRRARLIQIVDIAGSGLSERPFRLADEVVLALNGCMQIAPELVALSFNVSSEQLLASDTGLVNAIADMCQQQGAMAGNPPLIELRGHDRAESLAHAVAGLSAAGFGGLALPLSRLPTDAEALAKLRELWLRDSLLYSLALILIDDLPGTGSIDALVNGWQGPVAVITEAARIDFTPHRLLTALHDRALQRRAWQTALHKQGFAWANDHADRLAHSFRLPTHVIADLGAGPAAREPEALWAAARAAASPRDIGFVDRIAPVQRADQLVLPDEAADMIETIIGAGRAHHRVSADWAGDDIRPRGLGITALFAGESGTGKTMAAEAIAHGLSLDLYRVEVSAVVSKYIGETEKNLRRVFTAAEAGGGVLLFDEADTLFGKRSDVKDAHDRYANMEVGYLLQLMESYAGITILTTNIDDGLDRAFLRRLRFVVNFPLPGAAERARIWAGIFPAGVATETVDYQALARLSLTGGNIRNIALGASLRAAAGGRPVCMTHILEAARAELSKLGRPLSDIDQRSWT